MKRRNEPVEQGIEMAAVDGRTLAFECRLTTNEKSTDQWATVVGRSATFALTIALSISAFGCRKSEPKKSVEKAPIVAPGPTASADGVRRVAITVTDKGFEPAEIPAQTGEKLDLVFTRETTSPCGAEVMIKATGEKRELPLHEPVTLRVSADQKRVAFACGMDMMQGAIIVQ